MSMFASKMRAPIDDNLSSSSRVAQSEFEHAHMPARDIERASQDLSLHISAHERGDNAQINPQGTGEDPKQPISLRDRILVQCAVSILLFSASLSIVTIPGTLPAFSVVGIPLALSFLGLIATRHILK